MITTLSGWFNNGGPFMWVILGVLAAACAVVIERLFFLYVTCAIDTGALSGKISNRIDSGNFDDARRLLARGRAPVQVLLATALESFVEGRTDEGIQESVEEAAIQQLPRMSARLSYLALFANVATLLGLLGTIAGLQLSFTSLAAVEAARKATMLATGISQAMITTAFGLIVAIPCMIFYTILSNRQSKLTKDLDEAVVKLVNHMKKKRS